MTTAGTPTSVRSGIIERSRIDGGFAVIADARFDDLRLPFPPAWMQRTGLVMGAPIGRLLGYEPSYDGPATEQVALAI